MFSPHHFRVKKEKVEQRSFAGEMLFTDFVIEEPLNSSISRVASSNFGNSSLVENLQSDEDGE